jgi:hypothetical protein
VNPNAGPHAFLNAARQALARHRTGAAQEALERAETRALDRDAARGIAPTNDPMVAQIRAAREALGHHNLGAAEQAIGAALAAGPERAR